MQSLYADAAPLPQLKREQDRIAAELTQAERPGRGRRRSWRAFAHGPLKRQAQRGFEGHLDALGVQRVLWTEIMLGFWPLGDLSSNTIEPDVERLQHLSRYSLLLAQEPE
jgi:hypothetical protein